LLAADLFQIKIYKNFLQMLQSIPASITKSSTQKKFSNCLKMLCTPMGLKR